MLTPTVRILQEAEREADRERQRREPKGSDAVWAERKEHILSLLAQAEPSVSDLKRELRRLLGYADAVRSAVREERAELAEDLGQLVSPLVAEVQRLRGQLQRSGGGSEGNH